MKYLLLIVFILLVITNIECEESRELAKVNKRKFLLKLLDVLRNLRKRNKTESHRQISLGTIKAPQLPESNFQTNHVLQDNKTSAEAILGTQHKPARYSNIKTKPSLERKSKKQPSLKQSFNSIIAKLRKLVKKKTSSKKKQLTSHQEDSTSGLPLQSIKQLLSKENKKSVINSSPHPIRQNQAQLSFGHARLLFLEALEKAQDEKMIRLNRLENDFSVILPKTVHGNQKIGNYSQQTSSSVENGITLDQIPSPYGRSSTNVRKTINTHSKTGERRYLPGNEGGLKVRDNHYGNPGALTTQNTITPWVQGKPSSTLRSQTKPNDDHEQSMNSGHLHNLKEAFNFLLHEYLTRNKDGNNAQGLARLQRIQNDIRDMYSHNQTTSSGIPDVHYAESDQNNQLQPADGISNKQKERPEYIAIDNSNKYVIGKTHNYKQDASLLGSSQQQVITKVNQVGNDENNQPQPPDGIISNKQKERPENIAIDNSNKYVIEKSHNYKQDARPLKSSQQHVITEVNQVGNDQDDQLQPPDGVISNKQKERPENIAIDNSNKYVIRKTHDYNKDARPLKSSQQHVITEVNQAGNGQNNQPQLPDGIISNKQKERPENIAIGNSNKYVIRKAHNYNKNASLLGGSQQQVTPNVNHNNLNIGLPRIKSPGRSYGDDGTIEAPPLATTPSSVSQPAISHTSFHQGLRNPSNVVAQVKYNQNKEIQNTSRSVQTVPQNKRPEIVPSLPVANNVRVPALSGVIDKERQDSSQTKLPGTGQNINNEIKAAEKQPVSDLFNRPTETMKNKLKMEPLDHKQYPEKATSLAQNLQNVQHNLALVSAGTTANRVGNNLIKPGEQSTSSTMNTSKSQAMEDVSTLVNNAKNQEHTIATVVERLKNANTQPSQPVSSPNKVTSPVVQSTTNDTKSLHSQPSTTQNLQNKNITSEKQLSAVLQKAQSMFLKKMKEILVGHKQVNVANDKDDSSSATKGNGKGKAEGNLINSSAYIMDESPLPSTEKPSTQSDSNENTGIVPTTPPNPPMALSPGDPATAMMQQPNIGLGSPPGPNMEQSPPASNLGRQSSSPAAGLLSFQQQQEAHEEEQVASEQERAFQNIENAGSSPVNGVNPQLPQSFTGPNQLPQMTQYPFPNPSFRHHDVDDLDEYRGGMERYRLRHRFDIDEDPEDYYPPRRTYEDDDDDDDDDDEDGKKKSQIGKPHNSHKKTQKSPLK